MAHYRARGESDGRKRRFRLMLYAARPDAIHAEVVAPVGGTVLILDGNERRMSLSFVRERTAYVGEASRDAGAFLLGIELGARELVAAVLEGQVPDGVTLERSGEPGTYPESLVLSTADSRFELELRRLRELPSGSRLADGEPPAGFEQRPLRELRGVEAPAELEAPHPGRG